VFFSFSRARLFLGFFFHFITCEVWISQVGTRTHQNVQDAFLSATSFLYPGADKHEKNYQN